MTTFLRPGIGLSRTEQCLRVYVSYLSIGFLDIGIKKHQGQHRQHLWLLSNDGDCVTFHRLTAYHMFWGSYFDATLTSTDMARGTDTLWLTVKLFLTGHLTVFIGNMPPPINRAFAGFLSFFLRKVRVSRFTQKPFGLKCVQSPPYIWSKKYFLEISWKIPNSQSEKVGQTGLLVIEFLPTPTDFPIYVIYVGWTRRGTPAMFQECHWFRQFKPARILSRTWTSCSNK